MSSEEKKQQPKGGKRGRREPLKKAKFNTWIKSRREKRKGKGPWKGIFRDPVKYVINYHK